MTVLNTPSAAPGGASVFPGFLNDRVPQFLQTVVAAERRVSEREIAEQAVLRLNTAMLSIYDETLIRSNT